MNPQLFLLKLCSACVFFGRAYEHLFFDAPYRSILWDEKMFSPVVVKIFNMDWNTYVTNTLVDNKIQNGVISIGIFYFLCGIVSVFITRKNYEVLKYIIGTGAVSLIFLAVLQAKSNFYHFAMFFEHAIQFGSPIALLGYFKIKEKQLTYILLLKLIIALTFISHGLYAVGWPYPVPGNFVTMVMNILTITENQAKTFLLIAGCLDFLVAILIFLPKISKIALVYAVVWGLLTAFARIVSGLTYDVSPIIFHQYLFTTVYRIPHGLIPLFAFYFIKQNRKNTFEALTESYRKMKSITNSYKTLFRKYFIRSC